MRFKTVKILIALLSSSALCAAPATAADPVSGRAAILDCGTALAGPRDLSSNHPIWLSRSSALASSEGVLSILGKLDPSGEASAKAPAGLASSQRQILSFFSSSRRFADIEWETPTRRAKVHLERAADGALVLKSDLFTWSRVRRLKREFPALVVGPEIRAISFAFSGAATDHPRTIPNAELKPLLSSINALARDLGATPREGAAPTIDSLAREVESYEKRSLTTPYAEGARRTDLNLAFDLPLAGGGVARLTFSFHAEYLVGHDHTITLLQTLPNYTFVDVSLSPLFDRGWSTKSTRAFERLARRVDSKLPRHLL